MARNPQHDILFEPIAIGPKVLKNRFFQVPQCTGAGSSRPGTSARHREVKAEGDWAALCTESCMIHPDTDQPVADVSTLYDDDDVHNHRHMTESVHRWGALAGVELCHAGGLASGLASRHVTAAAHQFATPWMPQTYTYEAEDHDFLRIIGQYRAAAERAIDAGFDILHVHGTHGALPVQMLSRHHNRRTDRWGGSFENRARFWVEVLEAIRGVADGRCAVSTRFSIDQLSGGAGVELHDDGLKFIEYVTGLGLVDLWDINVSSLEEWGEDAAPSRFQKSNHQGEWQREAKRLARAPVVGVGRFTDPDEMARLVRSGQCDIIGCARPSIADPWLPRKVDEGRIEDLAECIGCNQCISRFEHGVQIVCTQNPTALEEYRRGWHPGKFAPLRADELVLVVGAGPAGLEAARVLGRRGYRTHLIEAATGLGGHLQHVRKLPGLGEWGRVVDLRAGQLSRMPNVEIMRGVGRATAEDLLAYGADHLVLATGAHWCEDGAGVSNDPIPGLIAQDPAIFTPERIFAGELPTGQTVILDSDGYFMAISLAEKLADAGCLVSIVTQFDRIAPYTDLTLEAPYLRRMMREKNISGITGHWVSKVTRSGSLAISIYDVYRDGARRSTVPSAGGVLPRRQSNEAVTLSCDSLVLCTGRRSQNGLYRELSAMRKDWPQAGIKGVYRAGDCLAPRYIADAVFDGHRIGREICSEYPQEPLPALRAQSLWRQ